MTPEDLSNQYPVIKATLRRFTRIHRHLKEDIESEVFTRLLEKIGEIKSVGHMLMDARDICRDFIASCHFIPVGKIYFFTEQERVPKLEEADWDLQDRKTNDHLIVEIIKELTLTSEELRVLCAILGEHSTPEIAQQLGCSDRKIQKIKKEIKRKLKEYFGDDYRKITG